MTTVLDKELKRQIAVDGVDYTVTLDADGMRLTGKGKRKPDVALRWVDLLSGDTALATALNASLAQRPPPPRAAAPRPPSDPSPTPKKTTRRRP